MGRWLTALKKHENPPETNPQNLHKSPEPIIEGFEGAASGDLVNFSDKAEPFLRVLTVPVSGNCENSPPDPDAFEERLAILEYDAGLSRAEAEQLAIAGDDTAPKTDAELYADALRQIEPCGYGPVAVFLGWGAGRASAAECELRQAGRLAYDNTGRGRLVNI